MHYQCLLPVIYATIPVLYINFVLSEPIYMFVDVYNLLC